MHQRRHHPKQLPIHLINHHRPLQRPEIPTTG